MDIAADEAEGGRVSEPTTFEVGTIAYHIWWQCDVKILSAKRKDGSYNVLREGQRLPAYHYNLRWIHQGSHTARVGWSIVAWKPKDVRL